jgi:hypothetical protein
MPAWPLAFFLAVGPRWAVLAASAPGDDPSATLAVSAQLSEELAKRGADVAPASSLGEVREVGTEAPPEAATVLAVAGTAFDDGRFGEAARLAQQADARLAVAPRSVAVEAAERNAQLLWGLSLAAAGAAGFEGHLAWVTARDPAMAFDLARFAPPLRSKVDVARAAARARATAALTVAGSRGASVYVDGVLRGETPLTMVALAPRRAWIWLERAGRHSLAHAVDLGGSPAAVAIDLELESHLALDDGRLVLRVLAGDPATPGLLARLARRLQVEGVAAVGRCAEGNCWKVEVEAAGRETTSRVASGGMGLLAQQLIRNPTATATAATPTPAPALPPTATEPPPPANVHRASSLPWIIAGAAVVAVGTGVALYFALRSSPDAAFSTQQGGL